MIENVVFITFATSTWFLCGLIWTIQLLHYPLFDNVLSASTSEGFLSFTEGHNKRITALVTGPWAVQGLAALAINPWFLDVPLILWALNWLLSASILASTQFLQIPIHNRLNAKPTSDAVTSLVNTNWIRTVAWTAQGIIAILFLVL